MIIQNGYIEFVSFRKGGGLDATTGHPIPALTEYGELIPCQFIETHNLQYTVEGEAVKKVGYSIYIDNYYDVASERIRLSDMKGMLIGEFSLERIEPLDAVCEVRLTI